MGFLFPWGLTSPKEAGREDLGVSRHPGVCAGVGGVGRNGAGASISTQSL